MILISILSSSDRYNRLGLDESKGLFMTNHIEKALVPTKVKSVKVPIVDLAMGPNHTVCITDAGKLITFGRNSEAQLGRGHARNAMTPDFVKTMMDKEVVMVSCGATFTVVGTNENVIYFWGTRFISPITRPNTRDAFNQSFGARLATPMEENMSEAEVRAMAQREMARSSGERSHVGDSLGRPQFDDRTLATLSTTELLNHQGEITMKDVVLEPQEILALYASPTQLEKGETVMLGGIESQNQNVFLIVETTCPLSRIEPPPTSGSLLNATSNLDKPVVLDMKDYDDDDVLPEDATQLPDWLANEMADADHISSRRPATSGGVGRGRPTRRGVTVPRRIS